MRGSRNFRQGGGPCQPDKRSSDNVFYFVIIFFSPQLILQKSNGQFQRNLPFFKVPEWGQHFPGGGGSNCFFPIENHITWFYRVSGPPVPPLDQHLTLYFVTVARLRRASANVQTRQSLRCQHMRFWYFLHCPVTTPAQMCRLTSLRRGVNRTKIAIWGSTRDFGTVTKAKVSLCKCVDSPEPLLLAQNNNKSPYEPAHDISLLWRGSGEPV